MTVKLPFEERKWLEKCYWKVKNVEVQRRWKVEFFTASPPWITITRIRDKFGVDGTVQDVLKGRCGRNRSSTDNEIPPRSPDLTPLDFYLWGTLRTRCTQQYHKD